MKVIKTIRESENYALCVVNSSDDEGQERLIYAVINKGFGVVEAEAHVLAQAKAYQDQLEDSLVEYARDQESKDTEFIPLPGSVIKTGYDH